MKLKAFSVSPFTKNDVTSCAEKLPDLGSIDKLALPPAATLILLFLLDVLPLLAEVERGLDGGEGEIKYLLGELLALIARTRELVKITDRT